jgi:hypothetical protein
LTVKVVPLDSEEVEDTPTPMEAYQELIEYIARDLDLDLDVMPPVCQTTFGSY